ncbi:MAG: sensor domain-containing diguanylate cyclase [Candidatus Omnitrophica bacterium]|nr:sensor domain-containing diguanylate cyclase [Candidatus Omnitrophota bacterium]
MSNHEHKLDDLINTEKVSINIQQSAFLRNLRDLTIPLGGEAEQSLLNKAFHSGQPVHITETEMHNYQNDILLKYFKTNELVIMPLKTKDKINGLIVADNLFTRNPINDEDLRIFTMLANQAGLAIENSQLYELVMHRSHTDSLTKLWNHGFFHNRLSHEIKLHKDAQSCLTLLLIDIDNFKLLNDQLGHQIGDSVLREMANLLKESCREIDCVSRYGGEEFAVILPNTNKEQGYLTAERIRRKIEMNEFLDVASQGRGPITVSIGLATFAEDAETNDDLIHAADKAMYKAKFGGKNQTYVSD